MRRLRRFGGKTPISLNATGRRARFASTPATTTPPSGGRWRGAASRSSALTYRPLRPHARRPGPHRRHGREGPTRARRTSPPSTTRASTSTTPPGRAQARSAGLKALSPTGETLTVCGVKLTCCPRRDNTPGGSVSYAKDEGVPVSAAARSSAPATGVDFPGSNAADMRQSLLKLFALPGETRVLPAHGEETTIARERARYQL